ncbi:MAG: GcrA family cell cycle regulator [Caulobacterales bacterium]|uniref:GcrA family cell cycle regulator n=1 Tax=Glycocaulis sp. TaxID=1969725 RepID=UPI003FA0ADFE
MSEHEPNPKPSFRIAWNDEREAIAKQMWSDGHTAGYIAQYLRGVTRNAVTAKLDRMGLIGAGRKLPSVPPRKSIAASEARDPSGQVKGRPRKAQPFRVMDARPPARPVRAIELPAEPRACAPYRLEDRPKGGCSYPVNDPPRGGVHLFCGTSVKPGSVYCADHHALCRVPAPKRGEAR